jgi:hypothetical protein
MPYKFNEARRHKYRRRVTNWPEYHAALVLRGSLIVWLTDGAIAGWHAPATVRRGGPQVYTDMAIEIGHALRLVFRLGLRQIEGSSTRSHNFSAPTPEFRISQHSAVVQMASHACRNHLSAANRCIC